VSLEFTRHFVAHVRSSSRAWCKVAVPATKDIAPDGDRIASYSIVAMVFPGSARRGWIPAVRRSKTQRPKALSGGPEGLAVFACCAHRRSAPNLRLWVILSSTRCRRWPSAYADRVSAGVDLHCPGPHSPWCRQSAPKLVGSVVSRPGIRDQIGFVNVVGSSAMLNWCIHTGSHR